MLNCYFYAQNDKNLVTFDVKSKSKTYFYSKFSNVILFHDYLFLNTFC